MRRFVVRRSSVPLVPGRGRSAEVDCFGEGEGEGGRGLIDFFAMLRRGMSVLFLIGNVFEWIQKCDGREKVPRKDLKEFWERIDMYHFGRVVSHVDALSSRAVRASRWSDREFVVCVLYLLGLRTRDFGTSAWILVRLNYLYLC